MDADVFLRRAEKLHGLICRSWCLIDRHELEVDMYTNLFWYVAYKDLDEDI